MVTLLTSDNIKNGQPTNLLQNLSHPVLPSAVNSPKTPQHDITSQTESAFEQITSITSSIEHQAMSRQPVSSKEQGFTLIEVMVALMILAVVATAASQASSGYVRSIDGMKTRTLANFVANNLANEIKVTNQKVTTSKRQVKQQGRTWQVNYVVEAIKLPTGAQAEKLKSVNINVAEVVDLASGKTGAGANITVVIKQLN